MLPAIPVMMLFHTQAGLVIETRALSYSLLYPTQTLKAAEDPGKQFSTVWSNAELPVHIPAIASC